MALPSLTGASPGCQPFPPKFFVSVCFSIKKKIHLSYNGIPSDKTQSSVIVLGVRGCWMVRNSRLSILSFITDPFYMQIILPAHLFTVAGIQAGPQTVPTTDRSLPSSVGIRFEIDLIRI